MTLEQGNVLLVGFPGDVEHVSEHWNSANHRVDRDIQEHSCYDSGRGAESRRDQHDVAGKERAGDVAEAGNESDE